MSLGSRFSSRRGRKPNHISNAIPLTTGLKETIGPDYRIVKRCAYTFGEKHGLEVPPDPSPIGSFAYRGRWWGQSKEEIPDKGVKYGLNKYSAFLWKNKDVVDFRVLAEIAKEVGNGNQKRTRWFFKMAESASQHWTQDRREFGRKAGLITGERRREKRRLRRIIVERMTREGRTAKEISQKTGVSIRTIRSDRAAIRLESEMDIQPKTETEITTEKEPFAEGEADIVTNLILNTKKETKGAPPTKTEGAPHNKTDGDPHNKTKRAPHNKTEVPPPTDIKDILPKEIRRDAIKASRNPMRYQIEQEKSRYYRGSLVSIGDLISPEDKHTNQNNDIDDPKTQKGPGTVRYDSGSEPYIDRRRRHKYRTRHTHDIPVQSEEEDERIRREMLAALLEDDRKRGFI